jgi:hypothetical protein
MNTEHIFTEGFQNNLNYSNDYVLCQMKNQKVNLVITICRTI